MKTLRIIFFFIFLFVFNIINGQITIDGTITDSESNPISDALIEIIDENDTSNNYHDFTNESGYFAISNITDISSRKMNLPSEFIVLRNYPNPFNPSTIIYYELPKAENIEIKIYDILGREVRTLYNSFHKAGTYTMSWDGRNSWNSPVAAGIYFCQIKTKDQFKVHKMVLLDGGATFASASSMNLSRPTQRKISKLNSNFNFTVKVSGDNILESEFQYLSCSSDTTLSLMVPKILQTAIIGPEGGKLENDQFSLLVPEGAFYEDCEIIYSVDPNDNSFDEYAASSLFLIDGIPDNIFKNLLIGIKSEDLSSDTLCSAIGQNGYNWGSGEEQYYFNFEPTFDSLGYYYREITRQQINSVNNSNSLSKKDLVPSSNISSKLIRGFKHQFVLNFLYWYPEKLENEMNVFNLLMADMLITFKNLGFTLETYEEWDLIGPRMAEIYLDCYAPRNNFIKPLRYQSSLVSPNIIQINEDIFENLEILSDVRREVAHLYYYKYFLNQKFDPQLTFLLGGKKWLDHDRYLRVLHHAIAAWCEEKFEPTSDNFVPHCFKNSEMQVFRGLFSWVDFNLIINDEYKHGFGLSALIKYLTNQYGKDILFNFYSHLAEKKLGADSFLDAIRESPTLASGDKVGENVWLPEFYKQYLSGKIYNVQPELFLLPTNLAGKIEFNDGDTLKYVDKTYNDLSAKLYKININSDEIRNKTLNFKIDPEGINIDYVKTLVFGLSNNNLTFLAEGTDFNVAYFQSYDALLACVVNSGNEPPFTGTSNIDLDIKVTNDLAFKYCDIRLAVIETHDTLEGVWSPGWYTKGTFKDNVFDGVINTEKQGGNSTGTIRIVVDDSQNILSLDVMAYNSDPIGFSSQWGFTAKNIPPTENEPYLLVYSYLGYDVCNYVKSIYAKYTEVDGFEWEIKNSKCDQESNLHIKFHNWD